jgi:cytidylate kinase
MPIITISHQMGSGGREIGQAVAKQLGLAYIDREIVAGVAQQLGIREDTALDMDEKAQSTVLHILSFFANGPQLGITPLVPDEMPVDEHEYFEATRKVISAAVSSGRAVIAGHGANFALKERSDTLNIFIYAPKEQRIATIISRDHVNHEKAADLIHNNDHDRGHYIKTFYGAEWQNPLNYQLMINTGKVRPALAVEFIVQAVRDCYTGEC